MSRLKSFYMKLSLLSLLIVMVLSLTLYTGHLYNINTIKNNLIDSNAFILSKMIILRDEMIAVFAQLPENGECDTELFSSLVAEYHFIKDVGIIKNNKIICNALSGEKTRTDLSIPTYGQTAFGKIWVQGRKYIVKKSPYFIKIDNAYMFNDIKNTDLIVIYSQKDKTILDYHWYDDEIYPETKDEVIKAIQALLKNGKKSPILDDFLLERNDSKLPNLGVISAFENDWTEWFKLNFLSCALLGFVEGLLVAFLCIKIHRAISSMHYMLKKDLEHKKLSLVYQPLVDLKTNKIIGCEALVRWKNRLGENVSPVVFIPIAEKYGLTRILTELVCEIALRDLHPYLKSGDFYLSINFTAADLVDNDLSAFFLNELKRYNVSLSNISIELTERSISDPTKQLGLSKLIQAGALLSIDDFGSGVSNIEYLGKLSPHSIKIDKQFTDWSDGTGPTAQLLGELIALGKSFKVKVVVEGVEHAEQAERIRRFGADIGQGYLWYKPMPIQDLLILLKKSPKSDNEGAVSQKG